MVNCVYVMARMLQHVMRAHKQVVSDLLNPHSLGTMSAFGYIDNLA